MDTASRHDVPTSDQVLACRPHSDDPTRLTDGRFHPAYVDWLVQHSYEDRHPFATWLQQEALLERVTDERGYFDRARVRRILGPSGPKMWLVDGPLPSTVKSPLLAEVLGVPAEELSAVVLRERHARENLQSMLRRCRWLPVKLLTWEQTVAGVPCPACGRPWVGPVDDLEKRDRWSEVHGDCHAGAHRLGRGPLHCARCCGLPAVSPDTLARVRDLLADAERRRQAEASQSPEAKEEEAERRASRRTKRIESLERELAALRAEEDATRKTDL